MIGKLGSEHSRKICMAEDEQADESPLAADCDALTIDTNIFSNAGYGIESGLLVQLEQFESSDVEFVFSDIVRQEIRSRSHLPKKIKDARAELEKAIRNSNRERLINDGQAQQARAFLANTKSDQEIADERLSAFMERCGAIIVDSSGVTLKEVTDMYFSSEPPFEEAGDKKSEFPDAIALLSLEQWAEGNKRKVLVVSKDRGWKAFCDKSEYLEHTFDLPKALAYFQPHNRVEPFSQELNDAIAKDDDVNGVLTSIEEYIKEYVEGMKIDVDATSRFYYEPSDVHANYEGHEFLAVTNDFIDLDVIRVTSEIIVVRLTARINCTVHASFSLSITDPIDKDQINMGSQDADTESSFVSEVLVTFEGDFSMGLKGVDVSEVEVVDGMPTVEFGEIEIDHDRDVDDEDYMREQSERDKLKGE
jgi:hypothetical protein